MRLDSHIIFKKNWGENEKKPKIVVVCRWVVCLLADVPQEESNFVREERTDF
jgi:hypothetical protein